ncbi:hypothetical protein GALMADRAFT_256762 [Galerina marginata CBS 339.88]|uniref:SMODS and SLOG-associating 2TM effector domain-containing protein n=1 Tax=Galerina marginata (strain CBS 339.88) TaxID=685588 RepID=A0A067SCC5_GALM3|nr:hypothetical protein GALMADRAFT_256762 [Galerina marginata CBS 339.88]
MASERANVPMQPSEGVPHSDTHPEPAPPSQEDPFGSTEGSPRRYAPPQITTASENAPPPSTNIYASPSSVEKHGEGDSLNSMQEFNRTNVNQGLGAGLPLPPISARFPESTGVRRQRTTDTRAASLNQRRSAIDWIVPAVEGKPSTLAQRLQPTLDVAITERDKYAFKAKWTGYALNAAIGLQVLLGSLTTGLSAVATTGKSAAVQTTILGGLSTIVASYLARARGSNEPELSITRVKDLEQFIRECESLKLDHGHVITNEFDPDLEAKRRRFEELLGNANGERKLSPV